MWRVHFVAIHEYMSRMGKIAAISRYIIPHPTRHIIRKIGLATLNTFIFRLWNMYAARATVKNTQNIDIVSTAIL